MEINYNLIVKYVYSGVSIHFIIKKSSTLRLWISILTNMDMNQFFTRITLINFTSRNWNPITISTSPYSSCNVWRRFSKTASEFPFENDEIRRNKSTSINTRDVEFNSISRKRIEKFLREMVQNSLHSSYRLKDDTGQERYAFAASLRLWECKGDKKFQTVCNNYLRICIKFSHREKVWNLVVRVATCNQCW